MSYINIL